MAARSKSIRSKLRPTVSQIAYQKKSKEIMPGCDDLLRTMFEVMEQGMIYIAPDGQIVIANPAAERILGLKHSEIEARNNTAPEWQILRPDGTPMPPEEMAGPRAMNEKRPVRNMVMGTKRPDGLISWINVSAVPLLDEASRLQGVLGIFTDITEKRQAEEALRENEEKYRAVLEGIEDGYYEVDIAGNLTFFNDSMCRINGYSKDEMLGMNNRQYMDKENAKKVYQAFNRVYATGRHAKGFGWEIIRKDGTKRFIEGSVSLRRNSEGEPIGFRGIARDVTERKQVDDKLRESEDRLRALIENAPEAIISYDSSGTILDTNKKAEELISYPREGFIGKNMFELGVIPDDYAPRAIKALAKADEGLEALPFEFKLIRKDGSQIIVEATTMTVERKGQLEILCIARDITEQKQIEERLKNSEAYQRAIIENIHDAIAIIENDGSIRYASPSLERVLGYGTEELLRGNSFDYIHPDDVQEAADMFAALIKNQGEISSKEVRIKHKDGSWRILETIGKNLLNDPAVKGLVTTFNDITEKKLAEEALLESEEKYRLHFNSVNDVIYSINRKYIVTNVSPSVERLLGYSPAELVGKPMFDLSVIHPQYVEKAVSDIQRVFRGNTIPTSEYKFVAKDGTIRICEASGSPLRTKEGEITAVVSIARDITDRRHMEKSLLIKENAIENSINAIAMTDMEGTITYINKACMKLWGNDNKDDLIGKPFWDLLKISRVEIIEDIGKEIVKNHRWQGELEGLSTDSALRRVFVQTGVVKDEHENPIQTISSFIDVTEIRQAEEALRESQEHFAALVENLSDAVFHFRDGVVTWCNDRVTDIYGYTKGELVGRNASFFFSEGDDYMSFVKKSYASIKQKGFYRNQHKARTKDGEHVDIEYSISRIPDKYPIELVAVARNVTEGKQLEQKLQLAGRLAAIGELSAGIAHELNNPLAAVQAFAQFLSEKKDLDESTKSDVETIYKESQRATRITTNLLSFARKHKPEKGLISINEALEKSLELHAYRMGVNNIEISMELDQELPMIMADFHQLEQVFVNIITNAEQAMTEAHSGGKLSVKTQMVGELIQITFTDDGPGIPEENLKNIFDPFFTTKDIGKGTGLGLSICFGIVQEHDGSIYARSKSGEGATFVVELPIIFENKPIAQESH